MSNMMYIFIGAIICIIINIIFIIYRYKTNKPNEPVGRIVINQSDPDKEYFECQLYSQEFFKEVHQKETVTFDVEIR